MPRQDNVSVENNFIAGLKTEHTGLNFPENACTDTDNCVFSIIGDVYRRDGLDYEDNFDQVTLNRDLSAISSYRWLNAGGDGEVQIFVLQVGTTLHFYSISDTTNFSPLSDNKLGSTVSLEDFDVTDSTAVECEYASGDGRLFVFNSACNPFFCEYNAGVITGTLVNMQVRDFRGIPEYPISDTYRPTTLSDTHKYNLENQGWTEGTPWSSIGTPFSPTTLGTGSKVFFISSETDTGVITGGETVQIVFTGGLSGVGGAGTLVATMTGNVSAYTAGVSVTVNVTSYTDNVGGTFNGYSIGAFADPRTYTAYLVSTGYLDTWFSDIGNYPSNSDVWWRFKDSSGVFDPGTTISNVTLDQAPAPKGHFVISPFQQQRASISGIEGLIEVSTDQRPRTGTWFQGRVWYAGVDGSFQEQDEEPFYTWTENIYFSQIVQEESQFGKCYQVNDPTSEELFDLLPSDGGLIKIQGCGSIYKLFPMGNSLLVFASNGIWAISGSQGVGFTANDYSISKISSIRAISFTSFVDVQGVPIFWNEEGIYVVSQGQENAAYGVGGGGIKVENLCIGTIQSFYDEIPIQSKRYARGDYSQLDFVVQWCFKSTLEDSITDRYEFDRILNFNVSSKAFYPWTISDSEVTIHGINYIIGPGGSDVPDPILKYIVSVPNGSDADFTFAEERDDEFVDWASETEENFESYFVTGYKLHGQALRKFQPEYLYMYSRNDQDTSYQVQGIWDYAISGDSGRYSSPQLIVNSRDFFNKLYRRHRIRGHGVVLQFKVMSVDGEPFDIMGWSVWETINQGI